ncbi:MAG TPA: hypothetical protein PKE57_02570 [Cellvibrionaceae bacterium]|nr:hypothetical protein [Cellvibrionaceae bacterium]HMW46910.1 hypothetical protein [Cellvibrionaceae bacterium]HMW72578.1 hypothetical protein [Cellvibrionaceae bacterium]HMY37833.1 hypothetical protein [Marinagarivorans sp.]HNG59459.1 hypothetical protein [Cellvibrionaceae bacterium]
MIEQLPIPLLSPITCVEQGFVYFGAWHTAPYLLYKSPRYLVIQTQPSLLQHGLSQPSPSQNGPDQLVIPRAAIVWLSHLVRHPFMRREGHTECFEGETLTLRRSAPRDGEGTSGFEIHNTSRHTGNTQRPQRALISDEFMHECLVPFMDGLNSGA